MESVNSSNFLFRSGGGLQPQGGVAQGSDSSSVQSNGNPLFAGSSGTGQQDILGQATVVGPVEFNASKTQPSDSSQVAAGPASAWSDPIVIITLLVAVIAFALMAKKALRSE
jgi:hypothetical protein